MRKLSLPEIDAEIEITQRDLDQLRNQRALLVRIERPRQAVVDCMNRNPKAEHTKQQLAIATGIAMTQLAEALADLLDRGEVRKVRWGVYVLSQAVAPQSNNRVSSPIETLTNGH